MNNVRRRQIRKVIAELREEDPDVNYAKSILEEVHVEEEEARDNIPESLREGERYQICDESCGFLEEAIDALDEEDLDALEEVVATLQQIDGV